MIHGTPQIVCLTVDLHEQASGAGDLHPRALSEPDVILSHHPAPIVQPHPCSSGQWANSRGWRYAMRRSQCRERRLRPRKVLYFPEAHRARYRSMLQRVEYRADGQNRP